MIQDDAFFGFLKDAWIVAGAPLLSAVGFSLGVRINKNNSDRQKKREIYQSCYCYFSAMKDGFENNNPVTYHIAHMNHTEDKWKLSDLTRNGGDALLPFGYKNKLEELEHKCFAVAHSADALSDKFEAILKESQNSLFTREISPLGRRTYYQFHILDLIDKEKVSKLATLSEEKEDYGINIEHIRSGSILYSLYIHKTVLEEGTPSKFIIDTAAKIGDMGEVISYIQERESILQELEIICRDLHKRIGDPDPFWETVRATLADIFR